MLNERLPTSPFFFFFFFFFMALQIPTMDELNSFPYTDWSTIYEPTWTIKYFGAESMVYWQYLWDVTLAYLSHSKIMYGQWIK